MTGEHAPTPDPLGDAAASVWVAQERRSRRRWLAIAGAVLAVASAVTWFFATVMSSEVRRQRERRQWLESHGCEVVSHRERECEYRFVGDYYECVPEQTCYRCARTKDFCE